MEVHLIDELIRGCAAALNHIEFLLTLNHTLDPFYQAVLKTY